MADVFVSYASEDRDRVRPLAEALQARGYSVWWDRALGAGEDYAAVISRELREAKAVIVVWTQASALSTFVRDEAGRARDEGRLIPVLFDRVEIPLGFGAFQAEDFTRWNGAANAAQIQILDEALKAKLEGRGIDGGRVAAKRRRLAQRIRIVSVLTVVAAIVAIAAGLNTLLNPRPAQEIVRADPTSELLALVREGKLSPDEAIRLAEALKTNAVPAAQSSATAAPGDDVATVQTVSITAEEFNASAQETFTSAAAELLTHPDPQVREATVALADPQARDQAMQTLWDYANANPASAAAIWRICGAVGEATDNPLGQRALVRARATNPQDSTVWRMLAFSYQRKGETEPAQANALVASALREQAQGDAAQAEQQLDAALPMLDAPDARAFVEGALGDAAASRDDWSEAADRYRAAFENRVAAAQSAAAPDARARDAPAPARAEANLRMDAQRLARALDRSGATRDACRFLRDAAERRGVDPADPELVERCNRMRILVRPAPAPGAETEPAPVSP
ncbi:MAG: TIR domain-containing protein [Alphaproteobacteria bacterium]|nr:TIR domain-containing protein [Alphaproteobacteria bacterium]